MNGDFTNPVYTFDIVSHFHFFFLSLNSQAARAAISGSGDSGAGAPLTSSPSPPSGRRAAAESPAPAKEQEQEEELWIGEEAALAEGFGAEVEGAIGAVLEQVGRVSVSCVEWHPAPPPHSPTSIGLHLSSSLPSPLVGVHGIGISPVRRDRCRLA